MDDTLRSCAYLSMFLIQNMRIVKAYKLVSFDQGNMGKNLV